VSHVTSAFASCRTMHNYHQCDRYPAAASQRRRCTTRCRWRYFTALCLCKVLASS
jgi:hypothetical protein